MILLDTDHLTLLKYTANPRCQALLANLQDFQKVPGLRVENWLS